MAVITLNLPTDEQEELVRRFTVNRNYLQAIARFSHPRIWVAPCALRRPQQTVDSYTPSVRIARAQVDLEKIRRYLLLSWTSEIQLHLPAEMGDQAMLGYANAWAPVHAYYAVYGGMQAWFAANGMSGLTNDHTGSLKRINNMIQQRKLFPEPWNLLAVGCPCGRERRHLNVPPGVDCTSHIEVLSIPTPFGTDLTFWQRMGTWLRSSREARLVARED